MITNAVNSSLIEILRLQACQISRSTVCFHQSKVQTDFNERF